MADADKRLTHTALATLAWLPAEAHWTGRHRLASGVEIDVIVEPHRVEPEGFIEKADELFQWAIENEPRMRLDAINAYLLNLYNDGWRQEEDPELTASEFAAQLDWQLLTVSSCDLSPVEYGYDPGEMFGGHSLFIDVGTDLRYRKAHLVG